MLELIILTLICVMFYKGHHGNHIIKKVSSGENSDREYWSGCCYGRHAEIDAIQHLTHNRKIKPRKKISLIVIRINKLGILRNSKPCSKCIELLSNNRYFKIKRIYYSNENGDIISTTLTELADTEPHVSMRFRV